MCYKRNALRAQSNALFEWRAKVYITVLHSHFLLLLFDCLCFFRFVPLNEIGLKVAWSWSHLIGCRSFSHWIRLIIEKGTHPFCRALHVLTLAFALRWFCIHTPLLLLLFLLLKWRRKRRKMNWLEMLHFAIAIAIAITSINDVIAFYFSSLFIFIPIKIFEYIEWFMRARAGTHTYSSK